jgi:hypothetical protein
MHLHPTERIAVLTSLATLWGSIGFRRKEVLVLREVQASVMDLIVLGREEDKTLKQRLSSVNSEASVGSDDPGYGPISSNGLGVRKLESRVGNVSIIRVARYIAEVHGIDLGRVRVADLATMAGEPVLSEGIGNSPANAQYGWPELQVGVVREALAIAEVLPGLVSLVPLKYCPQ